MFQSKDIEWLKGYKTKIYIYIYYIYIYIIYIYAAYKELTSDLKIHTD